MDCVMEFALTKISIISVCVWEELLWLGMALAVEVQPQ